MNQPKSATFNAQIKKNYSLSNTADIICRMKTSTKFFNPKLQLTSKTQDCSQERSEKFIRLLEPRTTNDNSHQTHKESPGRDSPNILS